MDINKYLEKHLIATTINGDFKEYDSIKSALVGSFQNDVIGCCFRATYFHKGMRQIDLNKTKYKISQHNAHQKYHNQSTRIQCFRSVPL